MSKNDDMPVSIQIVTLLIGIVYWASLFYIAGHFISKYW